jgi:hypothetical protein
MVVIIDNISNTDYTINKINNIDLLTALDTFNTKMLNIIKNDPNSKYYNLYQYYDPNNLRIYNLILFMFIIEINLMINQFVPTQ